MRDRVSHQRSKTLVKLIGAAHKHAQFTETYYTPGLPHEITKLLNEAMTMAEILAEATNPKRPQAEPTQVAS